MGKQSVIKEHVAFVPVIKSNFVLNWASDINRQSFALLVFMIDNQYLFLGRAYGALIIPV